jgi:hypothetical protein
VGEPEAAAEGGEAGRGRCAHPPVLVRQQAQEEAADAAAPGRHNKGAGQRLQGGHQLGQLHADKPVAGGRQVRQLGEQEGGRLPAAAGRADKPGKEKLQAGEGVAYRQGRGVPEKSVLLLWNRDYLLTVSGSGSEF